MNRTSFTFFGTNLTALAAAAFCVCLPMPVGAQMAWPAADTPMTGSPELMLGVGVANGPAYLGADTRKTRALPLLAARWSNGWFAGVGGVGYRFNAGAPLSWGAGLTFDPGRDAGDPDALRGMGDIKARPEAGLFVNYRLLPSLSLGSSLRYGSGNDQRGLVADFSLRAALPVTSSLRLTGGLTATYANSRAMQSQFGVDATQSLASGYAIFSPGSGWRDVGLQFGSMFTLGPNTMLLVGVNARTLMGSAQDSPLTRKRTGLGGLATLSFRL
jgi:MipA family protein